MSVITDYKLVRSLKSILSHLYWYLRKKISKVAPARLYSIYDSRVFDRKYGVETDQIVAVQDLDCATNIKQHAVCYQASKISLLKNILDQVSVECEDFTFIDFGSGKGRALMLAATYGFKRIIGVEVSAKLHKFAQENLSRYREKTRSSQNFELHSMDARHFPIPLENNTLFYFYNPFDSAVMATVLTNIEKSLTKNHREIFVVYVVPVCAELMDAAKFLKLESSGKMSGDSYHIYSNRGTSLVNIRES